MLKTTIAGSLPKPAWLAEPRKLWPAWRARSRSSSQAKRDATLLWLRRRRTRPRHRHRRPSSRGQHFVHGFLEFVDASTSAQGEDGHPQQPLRRDGAVVTAPLS